MEKGKQLPLRTKKELPPSGSSSKKGRISILFLFCVLPLRRGNSGYGSRPGFF